MNHQQTKIKTYDPQDHRTQNKNNYGMQSQIMNEIIEKCHFIAPTRKTILIIGEYGSGKGWIAKMIHGFSDRKENPFSKINCYSMPSEEIKRKLFGYISFTNESVNLNRGIFEKCDGGTIYLEGFDALPIELQQQILESIQNKSIKHVGSSLYIRADVRLITSMYNYSFQSHKNTKRTSNSIYEINPYIIFQPPLRNRREDIVPLIRNFLNSGHTKENGFTEKEISPETLNICIQHTWPGNIQQLKNAIKFAKLLSNGKTLQPHHLPKTISNNLPMGPSLKELQQSKSFQTAEKNLIRQMMIEYNSPQKIASCIKISIKDLEEKIEKYQLSSMKQKTD